MIRNVKKMKKWIASFKIESNFLYVLFNKNKILIFQPFKRPALL